MDIFNSNRARYAHFQSILMAATLVLGLGLASTQANAAGQCKGLQNNACTTNAACTWVQGYERKDGRTVKSFCRAKAKPKSPKRGVEKADR